MDNHQDVEIQNKISPLNAVDHDSHNEKVNIY